MTSHECCHSRGSHININDSEYPEIPIPVVPGNPPCFACYFWKMAQVYRAMILPLTRFPSAAGAVLGIWWAGVFPRSQIQPGCSHGLQGPP